MTPRPGKRSPDLNRIVRHAVETAAKSGKPSRRVLRRFIPCLIIPMFGAGAQLVCIGDEWAIWADDFAHLGVFIGKLIQAALKFGLRLSIPLWIVKSSLRIVRRIQRIGKLLAGCLFDGIDLRLVGAVD